MDDQQAKPVHISIIMDGNGRWAQQRGKDRVFGHAEGVESVRACTEVAVEEGIKYLSLYAFSQENWGRPQGEVDFLMGLMVEAMKNELPVFMEHNVRFKVLGDREGLSEVLNRTIDECEKETENNTALTFILFLNYSGKWDILQAAKKMAMTFASHPEREEEIGSMKIEDFDNYLVTAGIPEPDLIIRTSGEQRLSNYLLWQGAYSELYFTDVLWPDFRKEEFKKALVELSKRDRRYGKVK